MTWHNFFIHDNFVMQRRIGCSLQVELRNDKMPLITLSLCLTVVEYFSFYLNFSLNHSCTKEHFFTFLFYFVQLHYLTIAIIVSDSSYSQVCKKNRYKFFASACRCCENKALPVNRFRVLQVKSISVGVTLFISRK